MWHNRQCYWTLNVMLGQAPPCGTGTVKVSIDEKMMSSRKYGKKKNNKNTKPKTHTHKDNTQDNKVRFDVD